MTALRTSTQWSIKELYFGSYGSVANYCCLKNKMSHNKALNLHLLLANLYLNYRQIPLFFSNVNSNARATRFFFNSLYIKTFCKERYIYFFSITWFSNDNTSTKKTDFINTLSSYTIEDKLKILKAVVETIIASKKIFIAHLQVKLVVVVVVLIDKSKVNIFR